MNNTELLQQLKSNDSAKREDAALKISNSFDKELLTSLAEIAKPDAPEIELVFIKYLQNLPLEQSLSYLLTLSRSPNDATKKNVFALLDQINYTENPETVQKILSSNNEPLTVFVLKNLESAKSQVLLPFIIPLISYPSRNIAEAASKLISSWNFASSIPMLLSFLKVGQGFSTLLAIATLGRLSAFSKWKKLSPFIDSEDPEIRKTVVQSISLSTDTVPKELFLKALKKEKDADVIKELIAALKSIKSSEIVSEFIRLAALHKEPSVRKTANWAVNEYQGKVLKKSIKNMFNPKDEKLCRYLITKIGELQIKEFGSMVVSFLKNKGPLKYAALESLCLLKDKRYIDQLKPFIKSSDPMEAYLGTLAAANTVTSLDECDELKDIFFSTSPGHEVQKQSIIELMNSTISWDPTDESVRKALKANLESDDTNTRYLSLFLIKNTGDQSFIPLLTQKVTDDPDPVIRDTAVLCIDQLLKGNVGYYLKVLASGTPEKESGTLELLLKLSWDKKNTLEAVSLFAEEKWQKSDKLMQLAFKAYSACPRKIENYIKNEKSQTPWLLALAGTWLNNINPLNREGNKEHWLTLLKKRFIGLQPLLVQKAVDNKSKWAVEPLQESLKSISDPDVIRLTKDAVKKIIEL